MKTKRLVNRDLGHLGLQSLLVKVGFREQFDSELAPVNSLRGVAAVEFHGTKNRVAVIRGDVAEKNFLHKIHDSVTASTQAPHDLELFGGGLAVDVRGADEPDLLALEIQVLTDDIAGGQDVLKGGTAAKRSALGKSRRVRRCIWSSGDWKRTGERTRGNVRAARAGRRRRGRSD